MGTAAIGNIGIGSVGGMANVLSFTGVVAKPGLAGELASAPSSTTVNISAAAKAAAAADGVPATQTMSELAQALIVALLLQMLEKRSVN